MHDTAFIPISCQSARCVSLGIAFANYAEVHLRRLCFAALIDQ